MEMPRYGHFYRGGFGGYGGFGGPFLGGVVGGLLGSSLFPYGRGFYGGFSPFYGGYPYGGYPYYPYYPYYW